MSREIPNKAVNETFTKPSVASDGERPDAWERFERAVDAAAAHKPERIQKPVAGKLNRDKAS